MAAELSLDHMMRQSGEYVLLEITQEREDDEPGEDPKRYKCLDMDVAQPQVPPPQSDAPPGASHKKPNLTKR